jgi:hypothetical protein
MCGERFSLEQDLAGLGKLGEVERLPQCRAPPELDLGVARQQFQRPSYDAHAEGAGEAARVGTGHEAHGLLQVVHLEAERQRAHGPCAECGTEGLGAKHQVTSPSDEAVAARRRD